MRGGGMGGRRAADGRLTAARMSECFLERYLAALFIFSCVSVRLKWRAAATRGPDESRLRRLISATFN